MISKRRKHSNSFGRRPPSPPSRAGSQYNNRSISPKPSETDHVGIDDDEKNGGARRRSRGPIAEAGKFGKTRARRNSPPPRGRDKGSPFYSAPDMNGGIPGFATAGPLKVQTNKNKHKAPALERWESPDEYSEDTRDIMRKPSNGHARKPSGHGHKRTHSHGKRKRKPTRTHRGGSRKTKNRDSKRKIFLDEDDSPSPPDDIEEPLPDTKPPDRNMHTRKNTPFGEIELKLAQRRKSKEKIWGDEAHYDMATKNVPGAMGSGDYGFMQPALTEGLENQSSCDSERDSKSDGGDVIAEWQTKKTKKKTTKPKPKAKAKEVKEEKGTKRTKRKDKKRKQSVGAVLRTKISQMASGKKDKKEARKRKKSKERKEKERKKEEAKRKKEEEARRKKQEKEAKAKAKAAAKNNKKMDVMKSLEQTKKDAQKNKNSGRKKRDQKIRRSSYGGVLRKNKDGDDVDNDTKGKGANLGNNLKVTATETSSSSSSGRKKKSEKIRRRSTGEGLKDEKNKQDPAPTHTARKSNTLFAPGQDPKASTKTDSKSKNGRKSKKDKIRRRSVNDVIKGAFGSKKKTEEDKENTNTKRKSKKDGDRRVSLGSLFGRKKNKTGEKSDDDDDDSDSGEKSKKPVITKQRSTGAPPTTRNGNVGRKSAPPADQARKRRKDRGPKKPAQIQTNTRASSEESGDGSGSTSKSPPKRKPRRSRDKSDELYNMSKKIIAKTRDKHRAGHRRYDTPSYGPDTKQILNQEYEKANFSGNEDMEDENAVATDALSEDTETDAMYGADTPKAPPKGYRARQYRKQQVEIIPRSKSLRKGTDPRDLESPSKSGTGLRGFRARRRLREQGDDDDDDDDEDERNGNGAYKRTTKPIQKSRSFKIQAMGRGKKVQPGKKGPVGKRRRPVQIEDDDDDADSLTDDSEYETESGSESEFETTESSETGTGSESGSGTESGSTESGSYTTGSETESSSYTGSSGSSEETDSDEESGSSGSDDSDKTDSVPAAALQRIMEAKKSYEEEENEHEDELADYSWEAVKMQKVMEDKRKNKQKELERRNKEKLAKQERIRQQKAEEEEQKEKARKKKEEEDRKREKEIEKKKAEEEAKKKEEERKKRDREKQQQKEEAARKKKQIEEERQKREKLELEEQVRREQRKKYHEDEDDEDDDDTEYGDEEDEEEYEGDEEEAFEDSEEDSNSGDEEDSELEDDEDDDDDDDDDEDDSLTDNSDDVQGEIDAAMAAYVKLNSNDTSAIPEGDEHKDWVRQQAAMRLHKRKSTEGWRWNHQQLIAEENDDAIADQKELSNMWRKLKSIPKSSKKDTTETRIAKEFMMFQLNHDQSIRAEYIVIETMNYPNIYEWNGMFVGPMGTPYVNGKYRILIKFPRDYPCKPPKITFLTKIYNSSVKHNKRKKRGLLRLPKFFDKIWNKKISLRRWFNVVYEFLFFYCGDHFFDPMNQRVAREFIFAFDSFIDTCYQWNLIFANGYDRNKNMVELHDEYGERQKLTFHCAKYSNQYDVKQYQNLKQIIWSTIRDKYHATYESFTVLLDYFGNEFYYCGLSELIREPHICVKHKVKRYDNIVNW